MRPSQICQPRRRAVGSSSRVSRTRRSYRSPPPTSSISRYRWAPPGSTRKPRPATSRGCRSTASAATSRRTWGDSPHRTTRSSSSTFTATRSPVTACVPRRTTPKPPAPSVAPSV
ncbi:hypothetical protein I4F81_012265 [Pyropia yezoensis]|uniref:Uncharacterized protein n=1 Tax=Pyropia yezoensis TaxID=2788 RepID=A0ACC3CIQ1_PYRYE|nr:hypothetical protein I4F81_012265 [Neopyropia yezoensis]